ncbi:MAG: hypothetical protein IJ480_09875 [Clostridia bacterium]|nr:hypothetical protein [Clostridia bacterium]
MLGVFSRILNPHRNTGSSAPRSTVYTSQSYAAEVGPVVYYANTDNHSADNEFQFHYKKVNGSWRAYIIRMPSLNGRSDESHIIHRYIDNDSYYVCWDRPVNSLVDMQNVSRVWADHITEYIATGKRFGPQ